MFSIDLDNEKYIIVIYIYISIYTNHHEPMCKRIVLTIVVKIY